mmetsp:Transcript_11112/g.14034  ORF Transcript_11112/g.14034 Transcript_11112/m.14034 type:complete len:556 (+) Transcript_11112:284-1951(+)|eukprot:CAMPEP_0203709602 /NCGR_PEP_ID=MMETSP0091-20130426/62193_1 /ASSEMBLY_ACC=CAM_ASM_001089 /TAXON_ID=426623 /ORGANISM="Chaetoceros affinis, Strain CCMP159" /LENGTH=555 /DNA_ID=CAMNT_0050586683 /DNA_START=197 /DNA_END=1864 /DNA_ORIENTATION=+
MRISNLTLAVVLALTATLPVTTTSFAFIGQSSPAPIRKLNNNNNRNIGGKSRNDYNNSIRQSMTNLHDSFLYDQNIVNANLLNKLFPSTNASTSASTPSPPPSSSHSPERVATVKPANAQDLFGYSRRRINNRHAAKDWLHNIVSLPKSTVLKDVRNPVLSVTSWSVIVSIIYRTLLKSSFGKYSHLATKMCIGSHMHSLMISSLGLLLVFRTNSAYQRFVEGRKIWEQILGISRNIDRMVSCYENELSQSCVQSIKSYLASFPYLLRHHIRPKCLDCDETDTPAKYIVRLQELPYDFVDSRYEGDTTSGGMVHVDDYDRLGYIGSNDKANNNNTDERSHYCWVDRRNLPWCLLSDSSLRQCVNAINRPLWACNAIADEIMSVPYSETYTSRERLTLISQVDKLSNAIGQCERIHQTAVPLNYARHALRSLTIWLFTLPFALIGDLGLLTGPICGLTAWLMFGVYQIGHSIEDPFQKTLRLSILCNNIRRDVLGQNQYRSTTKADMERTSNTSNVTNIVNGSTIEVGFVVPSAKELTEAILPQSSAAMTTMKKNH